MIKHKAGLHKDVASIFDSVWIPNIDNVQFSVRAAFGEPGPLVQPKPLTADNWPQKAKTPKMPKPRSSAWSFFSPKARREKKRLTDISKHLLLNLPEETGAA